MTMAGTTLNRSDLFPVGTQVAAYKRVGIPEGSPRGGAPVATATVAADGSLTFTGLEEPSWTIGRYVPHAAYALVNGEHRWLWFRARRAGDLNPTF
jgi:hypothetical protein